MVQLVFQTPSHPMSECTSFAVVQEDARGKLNVINVIRANMATLYLRPMSCSSFYTNLLPIAFEASAKSYQTKTAKATQHCYIEWAVHALLRLGDTNVRNVQPVWILLSCRTIEQNKRMCDEEHYRTGRYFLTS